MDIYSPNELLLQPFVLIKCSSAHKLLTWVYYFVIGVSQDEVRLFRNNSDSPVCPGVAVEYTCVAVSMSVQWIVQELDTSTELFSHSFIRGLDDVGDSLSIDDKYVATLVADEATLVTTLVVFDLPVSVTIVCLSADATDNSMEAMIDCKYVCIFDM